MSGDLERHRPANQARRHFLGLAAAAGAKLASVSVAAVASLSSSARANNGRGNAFGKSRGRGNPHGGGEHCFLKGTAISTPTGEVAVEHLKIGDLVGTLGGEPLPIRWIGTRRFRRSNASWIERVMPVRVSRFAIDERTPHADLYLSPNHALFLDGVLMPVKELVNGITITPGLPEATEVIEYFHVILDSHEVILAEGTPAESCLLIEGDHENFTNFVEYERLYSGQRLPTMAPFAPLVGYDNAREHLKGLLRLGLSPFITMHDPVRSAHERIAARAIQLVKRVQLVE